MFSEGNGTLNGLASHMFHQGKLSILGHDHVEVVFPEAHAMYAILHGDCVKTPGTGLLHDLARCEGACRAHRTFACLTAHRKDERTRMSCTKGKVIALGMMSLMQITTPSHAEPASTYEAYIPEDKGLDPAWIASLASRGQQRVYRGRELDLIGMPCGGIGAGQLEVSGKGFLGTWWIFNISPESNDGMGYTSGARYLKPAPIEKSVENGFAIRVRQSDGWSELLRLDAEDFDDLRFVGEYPIARFEYRRTEKPLPVDIHSEVFSPFVPLCVRDSANPVTVLRFTVSNTSGDPVDIDLGGWLENACAAEEGDERLNRVFAGNRVTGVQLGLASQDALPDEPLIAPQRETLVYDAFERRDFGKRWAAEGPAFGDGPLEIGDVVFNLPVRDYEGRNVATSFHAEGMENLTGKLISEPFTIERDTISFRIGGGGHEGRTCINLLVAPSSSSDSAGTRAEVARTATGDDSNTFERKTWDVADLEGKEARLEIIDAQQGPWGFVMVDDIRFVDGDPRNRATPYGNGKPEYGSLAISVLDADASASAGWTSVDGFLETLGRTSPGTAEERSFAADQPGGGTVTSTFRLAPGESRTVTFLVSWYFPNLYNENAGGWVGHIYNRWYQGASDVARWVADHYPRLYEQTELFRATYHDTTMPYWLANRITMPVSTLACDNVKIHQNGRMYTYEGVSFCFGTCGHVYNFVAAIANLFPELERSVRLLQDFDERWGFDPETGRINFRGHDGSDPKVQHDYASDAQSGYVLKTYREHQHSPDLRFLEAVWPRVRLAMNYQVFRDGAERSLEPNGVLESKQTFWDPMWWGPNPYNNTTYLAALRAAEEMARLMGEDRLADRYRTIFERGSRWMQERMWNGECFVHLYPEGMWSTRWNGVVTVEEEQRNAAGFVRAFGTWDEHYFKSTGCDAQQLFGQNWAHRLGLGNILPPEHCRSAAASIFKYNWTPDISLVYDRYPPKHRTLAAPGEGAMVNGAWPKAPRQHFENIHDKDDVWSGLEYEAACDMIDAGLVEEALIMINAIDERYDPVKRNPWCEVEGAEHYSRAMQAWNVLIALSGYIYDGPAGRIGFAPRITPEDVRCFFSGAEGWGTYEQKRSGPGQRSSLRLAYGRLRLSTLALEVPPESPIRKMSVALAEGGEVSSSFEQDGQRVVIAFAKPLTIEAGQTLEIEMR